MKLDQAYLRVKWNISGICFAASGENG